MWQGSCYSEALKKKRAQANDLSLEPETYVRGVAQRVAFCDREASEMKHAFVFLHRCQKMRLLRLTSGKSALPGHVCIT